MRFIRKNWDILLEYSFAAIAIVLCIWVSRTCMGPGCLFGFSLVIIASLIAFIFMVITIIRKVKQKDKAKKLYIIFAIIAIAAILILSLIVGYFEFQKFNKIDECLDKGGTWIDGKCVIDVERMIQNHIFEMTIPVPETDNLSVKFNDIRSAPDQVIAYGEFSDKNGVGEGSMAGLYWQIKMLTPDLFIMPFYVNYGGSGEFGYLGLFSWRDMQITYLDMHFLDDRVDIDNIEGIDEDSIMIDYHIHGIDQSFSEDPQEQVILQIDIMDNKFVNPAIQ
ncbi:MAG TPA: hypothetical protein DCP02_07590 [Actinobacteria bacterium]|nr:hypothetical protein [Actinomycetota bacterium]